MNGLDSVPTGGVEVAEAIEPPTFVFVLYSRPDREVLGGHDVG